MTDALRYLKALADETRLRLCLILYRHELSVNELVNLLEMGQSRVSRHLKILADSGLIKARRDGLWAFYSAGGHGKAHDFLEQLIPFLWDEKLSLADLSLAQHLIEERALKTRQFFNEIAEEWDALNREILGDFQIPTAVLADLPPNCGADCGVAVDLGCGTGEMLENLLGHCREIIGVDGSPNMLELARRRLSQLPGAEGVSLRIGDLEHLPLRDAEADFACINLVLHHLSQPAKVLAEIARILKTGGRLFLSDFDRHNLETMRATYGDRWLGFPRESLAEMLEAAGLRIFDCQKHEVKMGLSLHLVHAEKS